MPDSVRTGEFAGLFPRALCRTVTQSTRDVTRATHAPIAHNLKLCSVRCAMQEQEQAQEHELHHVQQIYESEIVLIPNANSFDKQQATQMTELKPLLCRLYR